MKVVPHITGGSPSAPVRKAGIAQLAERLPCKEDVACSNHATGPNIEQLFDVWKSQNSFNGKLSAEEWLFMAFTAGYAERRTK